MSEGDHPMKVPAAASFLVSGPMILSVYMRNSIGLVVTLFQLAGAAMWSKPEASDGASPGACNGRQ